MILMGLACSVCLIDRPVGHFSPSQYAKPERVCKACCVVRDAPKVAARARQMRICTVCNEEKRLDYFTADRGDRKAACRACISAQQKAARAARTHLACSACKREVPREDFTVSRTGVRESRCRECMALRARSGRLTFAGRLSQAQGVAKRRGLEWGLTPAEYEALIVLPCCYCGDALAPSGVGLDRIAEDAGYVAGNVAPCCAECNLARGVMFSHEEMKVIGEAVARVKAARPAGARARRRGWGRPLKYPAVDAAVHDA
jgi:hypothetical protein